MSGSVVLIQSEKAKGRPEHRPGKKLNPTGAYWRPVRPKRCGNGDWARATRTGTNEIRTGERSDSPRIEGRSGELIAQWLLTQAEPTKSENWVTLALNGPGRPWGRPGSPSGRFSWRVTEKGDFLTLWRDNQLDTRQSLVDTGLVQVCAGAEQVVSGGIGTARDTIWKVEMCYITFFCCIAKILLHNN